MYEVIVVGAGPAGSSAAYYLAKAGMKVLLLERSRLPRFKPCAGGISLKFLASLPFDVSRAIVGRISSVRYFYELDNPVEVKFDIQMGMLNRQKFDHLVAEAAAHFGAELIDSVRINEIKFNQSKIIILSDKGRFESKYLIGADGVHSFVGRAAGLLKNRKIWSAVEVELPGLKHDPNTAYISFGLSREGYAWSFPKNDYFSVGIGGRKEKNLVEKLRKWMDFLGCKTDQNRPRIHAHPLPEAVPGDRIQDGSVLLVGDAAALVDPLTGEGIRYAIRSARIASAVILEGKLDQYSRRVFEEISSDFRSAFRAKWLFYRWPKFFYQLAVKNPVYSQALSQIFCGELSYRDAYRRLLNKSLNPFRLLRGKMS